MNQTPSKAVSEALKDIEVAARKSFSAEQTLLSFAEYLGFLAERPEQQLRGSAKYALDMMDFFGKTSEDEVTGEYRFHLFDEKIGEHDRKVVDLIGVQNQIYRALRTFHRQGLNNRLLLLHGPNGSAKSSLLHAMMGGLERYSQEKDGALYTFNWIFPVEKLVKGGSFGLAPSSLSGTSKDALKSYAHLVDEEVLAKIPSELRDHPLLLIPASNRRAFLEHLLGSEKTTAIWSSLPKVLTHGDLSHRSKQIFESLLSSYQGDLERVLMHVQVERFYFSRRYRKGLVSIEPQMHVDAHYQQLSMNKNFNALPASLQSLNLFSVTGDLVDGNRGLIEFSDLLKRPIDTFKYLLALCETGAVNVGPTIVQLDALMLGSTNELQLDAFKEFPDFMSFKARIELIRVPYLLRVSDERRVYQPELQQIALDKPVSPHTDWAVALWAVLTRLKKPNSAHYPSEIASLLSSLKPLEKAKLYDTGEMPHHWTPEERKAVKSSMKRLREEYLGVPYYEGRMGASPREMKSILYSAAQNPEFSCVSPLAVMREMEEFTKRVSEYEFLKEEPRDGYHDAHEFIQTVRQEYLGLIDREVRDSIGLYDSHQWEDFLRKYVQHVALAIKKEKFKNPITGKMEDPDFALIEELEKIIEAPSEKEARQAFRQNIISHVGAWSLDHPREPVVYAKVFPDFWAKLEKFYYESQKALLTKMHNALVVYGREGTMDAQDEGGRLARQTLQNMCSRLGYTEEGAREVITFLMKMRY